MRRELLVVAVLATGLTAACGDDSTGSASSSDTSDTSDSGDSSAPVAPVIDPGDGGHYSVDIVPADFTSVVDNPYYPLTAGSVWHYKETAADGEVQDDTVEVLDQHRTVMGVDAIVVHDVATTQDGELAEDTYDWFAQDGAGNVWYFGEDTTAYDNGQSSKEGSWEGGVDGALPGIVMPADPQVSDTGYRQEYLAGVAEDMGQVIADHGTITVPFGTFDDVIRTREWSPVEPDIVEEKVYARGVGVVHEETVSPADEHEEVVLVGH